MSHDVSCPYVGRLAQYWISIDKSNFFQAMKTLRLVIFQLRASAV